MPSISRPVAVLAITATVLLAGCVDSIKPSDDAIDPTSATILPEGWWTDVVPSSLIDPEHDHSDRTQHEGLSTPNFHVVGYDPLITERHDQTLSGMGCGGAVTRDDGRRLAVVHSISTDTSFVVADVTDPAHPQMVGEFYMPNAVIWDATITADGMHVLVGAYPLAFGNRDPALPIPPEELAIGETWKPTIQFRSACTGEVQDAGPINYVHFGPGIVMVGVQDPEEPTFEDWVPQPVIGPHSVSSALIDGTVYATASVTNLQHESSYYTFFEVTDTPAGSRLVPLSVLEVPGHPGPTALNGHVDVTIAKHPETDQVLAHLANWDGYYIYDITDPRVPVQVGSWFDGDAGNVHTTYPLPEMRDGKHYTIVGQEVGEPVDLPSGWVYIIDTTDPANPEEVGRWTLPVKPKWDNGGLQFSPHYVAVLDDTLFVSNYHGGLWAVDISDMAVPQAIGIFVPDRESPRPWMDNEYGPVIEDVIVDHSNGVLTTWDNAGGVYQLTFDAGLPAAKAPQWDA